LMVGDKCVLRASGIFFTLQSAAAPISGKERFDG
jgi:hypothetical protein